MNKRHFVGKERPWCGWKRQLQHFRFCFEGRSV